MKRTLILLALLCAPALAAPWVPCFSMSNGALTVCGLCPSYTVSKKADDVLVRCPGFVEPVFTFKGCRDPTMQRASTSVVIRCGSLVGA